jgi:hypothetical protein
MRFLPAIILSLLCAGMAGCDTAHSMAVSSPAYSESGTSSRTVAGRQLGIDLDFYWNAGANVSLIARQDVAYVKALGANAISISFPFVTNRRGSYVSAYSRTPSLADLSVLIKAAENAGLTVTVRPAIDEKTLGETRVNWKPKNLLAWFAAYQRFLLPYASLAQRDHVAAFCVGTELSKIATVPEWNKLDAALHTVYDGDLVYSNNWNVPARSFATGDVAEMVDAYPPFPLRDSATVTALTTAWEHWAKSLPRGTVLSEVGIPAQSGAYKHPYAWGSHSAPVKPQIQTRWFTAACHAVMADKLHGIYFWALTFGQSLTEPRGDNDPGSFVATPGATAITNCFRALRADS